MNRLAVLCSVIGPLCTTDSQICASYLIFADGYETRSTRSERQVSLIGILSVTPRQSGAALDGVVVGQGRQSNVTKYTTHVLQPGPWAMFGDYVAEAENAAGNDACAGRRDDDFASGQLRRARRPGSFPTLTRWPSHREIPVNKRTK